MNEILYSFRRCPYAMRARLAIAASGVEVELREVLLRDKAPEFLAASPSATVPCLKSDENVLDESLDIMYWALRKSDPEHWLDMPSEAEALIEEADGPFKQALDRTKYTTRYAGVDAEDERSKAHAFLWRLNQQIGDKPYLYGANPTLADMAILPFVRQFAFVDKPRFDAEGWESLSGWLERFLTSSRFEAIMNKYPVWVAGDAPTLFP